VLHEINWKIGGQQGEGIDSTGDVMALVCNRLGYYVYSNRVFSSRIKGGHTSAKVRIATRPVAAPVLETHVLIALDQETIDKNAAELSAGTSVIADSAFKPQLPSGCRATLMAIPLTTLARELQSPILRNTIALGASIELIGFPLAEVQAYNARRFGRKGEKVVQGNATALATGAEALRQYIQDHLGGVSPMPPLAPGDGRQRIVMGGNHACAMGAVAAGCRLLATYPITPAYEVMDALVPIFPKVGGAVIQMEDELASLAFCIGAGFAGARVFTATAGPGLSLMQENLGLAVITETPLVIVNVQRGGPSSGMATKHEQSDLLCMLHGTHGDAPRIVLAPGDPAEAFQDTVLAFNLADRFHTPVIVASDLSLGLWKQTLEEEDLDIARLPLDRGPLVSDAELEDLGPGGFSRYGWVPGGVSPRSLPGQKHGQ
jgi:2-oxoglutarate ferredoxin oxidoreductase subunit alpha